MKPAENRGECIVNPKAVVRFPTKEALPPGKGPKLSHFPDARQPVDFLGIISDPSSTAHSHVFKVKISGNLYALKMFHFYDPVPEFLGLNNRQRHYLRHYDLLYHIDPFFIECRAYGRINEKRKKNEAAIAVTAFGHMSLPASLEDQLAQDYGIDDWNRPDIEYEKPPRERAHFRAIVKDLVLYSNVWDVPSSRRMLRDLRKLRKLCIYNMDVKADNYVGNKLVDFSASCTEPSPLLDTKPSEQREMLKQDDLLMFDEMMDDEGVLGAPRASRNWDYCRKLRSHKRNVHHGQ